MHNQLLLLILATMLSLHGFTMCIPCPRSSYQSVWWPQHQGWWPPTFLKLTTLLRLRPSNPMHSRSHSRHSVLYIHTNHQRTEVRSRSAGERHAEVRRILAAHAGDDREEEQWKQDEICCGVMKKNRMEVSRSHACKKVSHIVAVEIEWCCSAVFQILRLSFLISRCCKKRYLLC